MKTTTLIATTLAVIAPNVLGAACTMDELSPILLSMNTCLQSSEVVALMSKQPAPSTSETKDKLCKIADCKKMFDAVLSLKCETPEDVKKDAINCNSSASATTLVSVGAVLVASMIAMMM
ncbi:hypothetical protein AC1031_014080 [Aphanomyces cochlioides]|nr:hypothetical protein AC1031_014080 [Aphanomyces cochlioides]